MWFLDRSGTLHNLSMMISLHAEGDIVQALTNARDRTYICINAPLAEVIDAIKVAEVVIFADKN